MSDLSDIKRRLVTVKQTRQITGAMETVSASRLRKATLRYEKSREFVRLIKEVMRNAVVGNDDFSEAFAAPKSGADVMLVLSSDRGLCGGFNNDIFKAAVNAVDDDTVVMPIGRAAVDFFAKRKNTDVRFAGCSSIELAAAQYIASELLEMYGNGIKSISIAYAEFRKQIYSPAVKRLLPITDDIDPSGNNFVGFELEPSAEQVINALVPLYLSGMLYGAITENYAAEQGARRAAMSAATESADKIINELTLGYNRARQSIITEQIVEIVGSTSALDKQGARDEKRI